MGGLHSSPSFVLRLPSRYRSIRPCGSNLWFYPGGCVAPWLGDGLRLFLRVSTQALVSSCESRLASRRADADHLLAAALRFFLHSPCSSRSAVDGDRCRARPAVPILRDQARRLSAPAGRQADVTLLLCQFRSPERRRRDPVTPPRSAARARRTIYHGAIEARDSVVAGGSRSTQVGGCRCRSLRACWYRYHYVRKLILPVRRSVFRCRAGFRRSYAGFFMPPVTYSTSI